MSWRGFYLRTFWLFAVLAPCGGYAQTRSTARAMAGVDAAGSPQTVEAALHQMSSRAAVIFVGTVAGVRRSERNGVGSGTVEIRFEVEQAIRGCSGGAYTLREWAGLWNANDARYHVGQRLLLMLHAPGATGLSSPVGGMDGAIPLRASGSGIRAADASTAAAEPVADLRWIGAKVARTVSYRAPAPNPAVRARTAVAITAKSSALLSLAKSEAITPQNATSGSSTPAQEAAVSTVVGMIRSWGVNDATR